MQIKIDTARLKLSLIDVAACVMLIGAAYKGLTYGEAFWLAGVVFAGISVAMLGLTLLRFALAGGFRNRLDSVSPDVPPPRPRLR